ncbi:MAG TPA: hypothetical protein VE224_11480 [Pseudolabrys sp.]|jgi:hypothetical protein|nr:hypothetical protein [Pseudolabrys sp.]
MADKKTPDNGAKVFSIETTFQKQARRPGGVPRDKAIEQALEGVESVKPQVNDWVGSELDALAAKVREAERGEAPDDWVEQANRHARHLRDVGTTMGSELLTYIAGSLSQILDEISAGAKCNIASITLHVDALFLARQRRYWGLKPDQVPELTAGLRRVVDRVTTSPN